MSAAHQNPICPRCASAELKTLYLSPVPGAWEVRQCQVCLYCWRTSEPARRTERAHYPQTFRLTEADLRNAIEMPTVPPLGESGGG